MVHRDRELSRLFGCERHSGKAAGINRDPMTVCGLCFNPSAGSTDDSGGEFTGLSKAVIELR